MSKPSVWMITVAKAFANSILVREKSMELRTRIPGTLKVGDVLLICQAGNGNRVYIRAIVGGIVETTPGILFGNFFKQLQINYLAYHNYTKSSPVVYGIMLCKVESLIAGTSMFGIDKNPQWFRHVDSDLYYERTLDEGGSDLLMWR